MTFYPIFFNYDPTQLPVGRVELIEDNIPKEILPDIAIVPALIKDSNNPEFRIVEFGLVLRTNVDTRPRAEMERQ